MPYSIEHTDQNRLARTAGLDKEQAVRIARQLRDNGASFRILDDEGQAVELYSLERAGEADDVACRSLAEPPPRLPG